MRRTLARLSGLRDPACELQFERPEFDSYLNRAWRVAFLFCLFKKLIDVCLLPVLLTALSSWAQARHLN